MKDEEEAGGKEQEKPPTTVFPGQSTMFGGLPSALTKVPIIKDHRLKFKPSTKHPKKFSLNDYLDHYLQGERTKETNLQNQASDEALRMQKLEQDQIETQYELKDLLKIRTFDEIQLRLSERKNQDRLSNTFETGQSRLNPTASCLNEPLNLHIGLNQALNPFWEVK